MPDISNKAVKNKTGKNWEEWFGLLDDAGAQTMEHKEIASYLRNNFELSGWWAQSVTVEYERSRDMRQKYEKPGGFEATKSKTFSFSVNKLYYAWEKEKQRRQWLENPDFTIRKSTENKSLRITWPDDTHISVEFYPKGKEKTQVTIQHSKLKDKQEVMKRKTYWQVQLNKLGTFLKG